MGNAASMSLDWLRVLALLAGNGLVVALVTYVMQGRRIRRDSEVARIREQLQSLYGPVSFYSHMNLNYTERGNQIDGLEDSPEGIGIDVRSWRLKYGSLILENRQAIVTTFRDNIALADAEDLDMFRTYAFGYACDYQERTTPEQIISYLREGGMVDALGEFADERISQKLKRLRALGG